MHRDDLTPDVYEELRAIAARCFHNQAASHTLQPTALANEAWLKLARHDEWNDRTHFLAVAARAMRQILVDHARAQLAARRGGDWQRVTLSGQPATTGLDSIDVLALDEALERLAAIDERQARMIEYRFFAGLTSAEIAESMDLSRRTVDLDLSMARAWLARALGDGYVSDTTRHD